MPPKNTRGGKAVNPTPQNPKPKTQVTTKASYSMSSSSASSQATTSQAIVPRNTPPTRRWADIADEEEARSHQSLYPKEYTPQEYHIQSQQCSSSSMVKPQQSFADTAKAKAVVEAHNPTPVLQKTSYTKKPLIMPIMVVEKEFRGFQPTELAQQMFFPKFHYPSTDPTKNQRFYEFILVDTDSARIKHHLDDNGDFTHSSCHILKIMTPTQWGQELYRFKRFSEDFKPQFFNYFDYQRAWYNAFYYQNKIFRHSWMFYFDNEMTVEFPHWFLDWWNYFGPIPEVLPPTVREGYSTFQEQYNSPFLLQGFPKLLLFFAHFGASWVMFWAYEFLSTGVFTSLGRSFNVKWWENAKLEKLYKAEIIKWFKQHPAISHSGLGESSRALVDKSAIMARLAAAPAHSRKEIKKQLIAEISSLGDEDDEQVEEEPDEDFTPLNGDDCYGIYPPAYPK